MRSFNRFTPLLLLTLLGCEDPLKEAARIEEPRILGVRVTTESGQSSLNPGQSALLDVLVAGPDGPLNARLAYRACEAADSDRGVPYCRGNVFAENTVELNGNPIPLDIPASIPPGIRLAVLGAVCIQSEPLLAEDPLDFRCSNNETVLRVSFDARTTSADFANQNPDVSELRVTVDGVGVPLDDIRTQASCTSDAPAVGANAKHTVEIQLGPGARELGDGESLQVSHFSTSGLYDRHYSFIEAHQESTTALAWSAPGADTPAKHYVVVRDGRGGVSWASFGLCAR